MSRRLMALAGAFVLVLGLAAGAARTMQAQEAAPEAAPAPSTVRAFPWERWNALSDDQKAELQAARNRVLDARLQLLEIQAELGLIDPRVVDLHRQRIEWLKQAPPGAGPGLGWGCPGYGLRRGPGFGVERRGLLGPGRGPAMRGWGMMGPGW